MLKYSNSNQLDNEEVKLLSNVDGIGEKCYATAKITDEKGEFPNKKYYTQNKLKYLGLYTRDENSNGLIKKYFYNPLTEDDKSFEMSLFNDVLPSQNDGFVEVKCYKPDVNYSLEELSRHKLLSYIDKMPLDKKTEYINKLKDIYKENPESFKIIMGIKSGGKKRRKTKRKRTKRKYRKNRRKTSRY